MTQSLSMRNLPPTTIENIQGDAVMKAAVLRETRKPLVIENVTIRFANPYQFDFHCFGEQ